MKKILGLSALLALGVSAPAMAQGMVVLAPGGGTASNTSSQPTQFLNTDTAQVLPDGQGYLMVGGGAAPMANMPAMMTGTVPGAALNYMRGMGNNGEFSFGLGLGYMSNPSAFNGAIGLGWKQSFSQMVAGNIALGLGGVGSGTTTLDGMVGLPISVGSFVIDPRLEFPTLVGGGSATAGSSVQVALGYQTPIATNWSFLGDVVPTYGLNGGGFSLPLGLGLRFSPTSTSAVDFDIVNLGITPGFTANVGLLGVTGWVGF
ncbi:MAG TPA: hypothetical protein V6D47_01530 [Oscillatoriaceae cyanobacterium]